MLVNMLRDGAWIKNTLNIACLLYTSDAADERSSVDLGGRRIIKKQKHKTKHNNNLDDKHTEEPLDRISATMKCNKEYMTKTSAE